MTGNSDRFNRSSRFNRFFMALAGVFSRLRVPRLRVPRLRVPRLRVGAVSLVSLSLMSLMVLGLMVTATPAQAQDRPTATITNPPKSVANRNPIDIRVVFSSEVSDGDDVTYLNVTNAVVNFVSSDDGGGVFAYNINITPTGGGNMVMNVPADAFFGDAGGNLASPEVTVGYTGMVAPAADTDPPTVTLISFVPGFSGTDDTIQIGVDFSEEVMGFDSADDISVTGGEFVAIGDDGGGSYTLEVRPTGTDNIVLSVVENAAADGAGNGNTVSNTLTVLYDGTAPVPTIMGAPESVSADSAFPVTVRFSEEVELFFEVSDITVTGATNTAPVDGGDGITHTFTVTPNGTGDDIVITVRAGAARDLAGNFSTVSAPVTVRYIQPVSQTTSTVTVSPASVPADGVSASTITVQLKGTIDGSNTTAGAGQTVSISLGTTALNVNDAGAGDGRYTAVATSVVAGDINVTASLVDESDPTNPIELGEGATITFVGIPDLEQITITATDASILADGTSTTTITVQLKDGNGADLDLNGPTVTLATDLGTLSEVTNTGADGIYTAILTAASTLGTATISGELDDTAIMDTATVTFIPTPVDPAQSTVTVSPASVPADGTTVSTITVQLKDANGNNTTAGDGQSVEIALRTDVLKLTDVGDGLYTAPATSTLAGVATVTAELIDESTATVLGARTTITFIGVPDPAMTTITADPASILADGASTTTITVQLKDAAGRDLDLNDPAVTLATDLGTLSAVTNTGADGIYTAILTAGSMHGTATISGTIDGTAITDTATVALTVPPVSFTSIARISPAQTVTNANSLTWRLTFSDTVDMDANAIQFIDVDSFEPFPASASIGSPVATVVAGTNSTQWDVTIASSQPGNSGLADLNAEVTLYYDIQSEGRIRNRAGTEIFFTNDIITARADAAVYTVDNTAPTVVIASQSAAVGTTDPFDVTITFSESVNDFTGNDITVDNGSAGAIGDPVEGAGGTVVYTVPITPDGDDDVEISVAANRVTDLAGNDNTVSNTLTVVYDATVPTVTITPESDTLSGTTAFSVTVTFSVAVSSFDEDDITVTNATAAAPVAVEGADAGTAYTVEVTPEGDANVVITVAADLAANAAGLGNAVTSETVTYDPPVTVTSVARQSPAVQVTNADTLTWRLTFSEDVTIEAGALRAIAGGNFLPTNPAVAAVGGNNTTWDVTIAASQAGNEALASLNGDVGLRTDPANAAGVAILDGDGNPVPSAVRGALGGRFVNTGYTLDNTAPIATFSGAPAAVGSGSDFDVTVTFDGPVNGFEQGDVSLANGDYTGNGFRASGTVANAYIISVEAIGGGPVTITIPANAARDAAGNGNAETSVSVPLDEDSPTVVSIDAEERTNSSPFTVTVTFDEDVMDFDAIPDDNVTNGTAATPVQGDNAATYTVSITPTSAGAVVISIPEGAATDLVGNPNVASADSVNATVMYDPVAPTVTSIEATDRTNSRSFTATVTFSEPVTDFDVAADISVTNGSAAAPVQGADATTYTVQITATAPGDVEISIPEGAATDLAGNGNAASADSVNATVAYDTTAPGVISIVPEQAAIGPDTENFDVTVTFSEVVTGFDAISDVVVGNGTAAAPVQGDNAATYTVSITPTAPGPVTIRIPASVATDLAANNNTASTTTTVPYDGDAPTVTLTGAPASINFQGVFIVTVTFSEEVTDFTGGDIVVMNGGAAPPAQGDNARTYTFIAQHDGTGNTVITIPAGAVEDAAGNGNAEVSVTVLLDRSQPTVTGIAVPAVTNGTAFTATVTFSETVRGFDAADDLTVTGGSAAAPVADPDSDGTTYTVLITPTPDGTDDVTITVNGGRATDVAGNGNVTSNIETVTYDGDAPTATLSGVPDARTNDDAFTITVTFNEAVMGFDVAADISVTNGSAAAPVQGASAAVYTVAITPNGGGNLDISIPAGAATDRAGNASEASDVDMVIYDTDAPTVTITGLPAVIGSGAGGAIDIRVTFSEEVTGFNGADDILVTSGGQFGGASADLREGSSGTYFAPARITPGRNGNIVVTVPAGAVTDLAGNGNLEASVTVIYDTTAPTVTNIVFPERTNQSPFTITVTFSEPVRGFGSRGGLDVEVTNGTDADTAPVVVPGTNNTTYTVEITPTNPGDVEITVEGGAVTDPAGNANPASDTVTVVYDPTRPTVTLESEFDDVTSNAPFTVTVTLDEAVEDFTVGDIEVTNATADNFAQDGTNPLVYTARITPDGEGDIEVTIPANAFTDAAGNGNAETSVSVGYDATPPTVTITAPEAVMNTNQFTATVTFSESVTGFGPGGAISVASYGVTNGRVVSSIANQDIANAYNVIIEPDTSNEDMVISVAAGVVMDRLGNRNTAATPVTVRYDTVAPTVSISAPPVAANDEPFDITVTFSEPVEDFAAADVSVTNGSTRGVVRVNPNNPRIYRVSIVPDGMGGNIGITIAADVATDLAGNNNAGLSAAVMVVYNTAAPTVLIDEPMVLAVNDQMAFTVTVRFSAAVTGFDAATDVSVINGSATAPVADANDAAVYTVDITANAGDDGDIVISIPANAATADNNGNVASPPVVVRYDTTPPTVTIETVESDMTAVTSEAPFDVRLTFSERPANLEVGDISVENGSADDLNEESILVYTVDITANGDGPVTISIPAGAFNDDAENDSTAASLTLPFDDEHPTVEITAPAAVNDLESFPVTVEFSEPVTGFTGTSEIVVTNCTAGNPVPDPTNPGRYTVQITPNSPGNNMSIAVRADAATDAAGNGNVVISAPVTVLYDATAPTVNIFTGRSAVTNQEPFNITVGFSEPVTDFTQNDIMVTNGSAGVPVANGAAVYTVPITPDGMGDVTISVPAGAFADRAGNANTAEDTEIVAFRTVRVMPMALSVGEAGGQATYSVVLTSEPTATVTITPSSNDTDAATISPATLTFTDANWSRPQRVTVTGVNDDDVNDGGSRSATISHAIEDGGYGMIDVPDVAVTVADDDGGVTVSSSALTIDENGGSDQYTVVLSAEPTSMVTVGLTSDDTNIATVAPASLTFTDANWDTPQPVTVTGVNDNIDNDPARTTTIGFTTTSDDDRYSNLVISDVAVTLTDDDTVGVTVSEQAVTVAENGGEATYTVALGSQPTGNVTVDVASSDTDAAIVSPARLTFTPENWNDARPITVTGINDDIVNAGDERSATITTTVSSTADAAYEGFAVADLSVTVTNDDVIGVTLSSETVRVNEGAGTGSYTLVLDTQPTSDVTITPDSSDEAAATVAPATLTFTADNWNTPQIVTVTGVDDGDMINPGGSRSATISHGIDGGGYANVAVASVAVTVVDNDGGVVVSPVVLNIAENGGTGQYSVVLNVAPTDTVTVTVTSADTNVATVTPARLTFTSADDSWNTPQTITVTGVNDNIDNDPDRTTTIGFTAASEDPTYGEVEIGDVTVTLTDDDEVGIRVAGVENQDVTIDEDTVQTYNVTLGSQPTADVTVDLASSDETIATVSPAELTFTPANWNRAQSVTLTGVNDNVVNADGRSATISYTVASDDAAYNNFEAENNVDITVTVTNDDAIGVTLSRDSLSVLENEREGTYTLVLDTVPTADVTITPASSDVSAATVSGELTFTADNWNTPQTVTVTGVNDDEENERGRREVTVTNTVTSTDDDYDGFDVADVEVTVRDDDGDDLAETVIAPGLARFGRTVGEQAVEAITARIDAGNALGFNGQIAGQAIRNCDVKPGDDAANCGLAALSGDAHSLQSSLQPLSNKDHGTRLRAGVETRDVTTSMQLGSQSLEGLSGGTGTGLGVGSGIGSSLASLGNNSLGAGSSQGSRDLLTGTSFATLSETERGARIGFWGRGTFSRFEGSGNPGGRNLSGDVVAGMVGTDWHGSKGLIGLMASQSFGDIKYGLNNEGFGNTGKLETNLTALMPYASLNFSDRVRGWLAPGYGWGSMTLKPQGEEESETDIDWYMVAAGLEGALIQPGAGKNLGLDVTADFLHTGTSSDAIAETETALELAKTSGTTQRVRLGLDARWEGKKITPHINVAMRHDSGDAETGFGLETGGGFKISGLFGGLDLDFSGRTLAFHEDGNFKNWGLGLSLIWDPAAQTRRGWSARLAHDLGSGSSSGGQNALLGSSAFPTLSENQTMGRRWSFETAYGLSLLSSGFVGSPHATLSGTNGVDRALFGYRIEPDGSYAPDLGFDIWGESDFREQETSAGLKFNLRW